jgi:superfamily II RNA helicase
MSPAAAPLADALPADGRSLGADDILERFVGFVASKGLSLYPAQEEAILELLSGKHVILSTPTGSGKSLVATALLFRALAEGKRAFYTCPIKALVNEKFFDLCDAFGAANVGMLTGDASINRDARIVCCTAEVLANFALREPSLAADFVVMDEFHYYGDRDRGAAWQIPLLLLPKTTFLLMSATLGDTSRIEESLTGLTGKEVASIRSATRPVPLDFEYCETPLHETLESLLSKGKAPVYLVNFTQRAAAEQAQNLMSVNFCSREEKERIKDALGDATFDTPYGKELQRFLRHGVGLHHAGLLPRYRLLVEKLSQSGLLKVISGTDTLGVGVNIPIRTVLFTQLCKFDGEKTALLKVRDFLQVAGRAGRKGFDVQGTVAAQAPEHVIENLRIAQKEAAGKKKLVKKQPPTKGFVMWDRKTFDKLVTGIPEPLESRFDVTHGLLLNLLQADLETRGGGYGRLVQLVMRSHASDYVKKQQLKKAARAFRVLRNAKLVEVVAYEGRRAPVAEVSSTLQRDFSLNHTLSLYLLEALAGLEREKESYALDVLSLVESILENPDVVLYAQQNKLKGEKVAELKAQGVEYEERMEQLEKVEYPKPLAEYIYPTFNTFAEHHPWVGQENIRPKSIARELVERYCTFNEYIREYGLERSEGVLLRYLTDAFKTLVQSVPESYRTEALDDVIAHLREVVKGVDSSLLEEWERLLAGPDSEVPAKEGEAVPPKDPVLEGKALAARVRAELHRLVKALADKSWAEASALVRQDTQAWPPERFEAELTAGFLTDHPSLDATPRARNPRHTLLKPAGPRRWDVQQRLLGPDGEGDWMLDCAVDLNEGRKVETPFLELRAIRT